MRVKKSLLKQFVQEVLLKAGVDPELVNRKADILVWADSIGRDTQGLWRLALIVERIQNGLHPTKAKLKFEQVAPGIAKLDGDSGLGRIIAAEAMDKAIKLAASQGVGYVAVRNSSHIGAAAYYVCQAAQANMVGLCFSNSFPKVVPPGGRGKVFGTNPLAIGCPRENGLHVMIDMSTSISANSKITQAQQLNLPVKEGILVDSDGQFSTSASDVFGGGLLPMAGGKGFGLGFAVELLSAVITGAGITHQLRSIYNTEEGPANNGQFMMAIAIEPLMEMTIYYKRLEALIKDIHQAGGRVPGELRWYQYDKSERDGVLIDDNLKGQLERLAIKLSINTPWT